MPARALAFPFLLIAAAALAQEKKSDPPKADDPIAAQLLKDKEAYTAAVEKARGDLLKAFDKHYDAVKGNKTLKIDAQVAQLEKLESEKKAFEADGTTPLAPGLKSAVETYRNAVKKAEAQCKKGFENAARAYRDKGDVKTAGDTLDGLKDFLAKGPGLGNDPAVIGCHVSGKVFGPGGAAGDGVKVVTADPVRADEAQLWRMTPGPDGCVYLEHVKTGLVATARGKNNGVEVVTAKKVSKDDEQLWKPVPVPKAKDGLKFVHKASDLVLAVDGRSRNAGARIILWADENDSSQWFAFFPQLK